MPLVSADAEASALSGFVVLLPVGDKPMDIIRRDRQGCVHVAPGQLWG